MKLERTKNASRNIIFGMVLNLYKIMVPFLIRTIMIYYLGMEYVGVSGLFKSILQMLNLAELGVGSAMVFSMYKPIAEDDTDTICALLHLYKKYYRYIGLIVLVIGVAVIPFLKYLIKGSVPDGLNLYTLYLMNLLATVSTYWFWTYRTSLFTAFQRVDIVSKVSMIVSTIEYALEIFFMIRFHSYYLYLTMNLISPIVVNIVGAILSARKYPQYKPIGQIEPEIVHNINQRVKDLFTSKVGSVIVNSADSIVISAFLGLTVLGIYNNYFYVITSVISIFIVIYNAVMAGIGNSLETESPEKNYLDFTKFTFLIAFMSGCCTCLFLCLYQPFMHLWVKEQSLMFGMSEVLCFCAYFYVYELISVMIQYKDAAGIWHEDRFRPLLTALTNLLLNILLVGKIGIFGVLLSTVISFLLVGMPWLIHNIFSLLFFRSPWSYVKRILYYTLVTCIVCAVCYFSSLWISVDSWLALIFKGMYCAVIAFVFSWLLYHKLEEYHRAYSLIINMLPSKIRKIFRVIIRE